MRPNSGIHAVRRAAIKAAIGERPMTVKEIMRHLEDNDLKVDRTAVNKALRHLKHTGAAMARLCPSEPGRIIRWQAIQPLPTADLRVAVPA